MGNQLVRNFCIIAHIDHGKSTLCDRFLEVTGTVPQRQMRAQLLDQMDLERERGITIKLQPVTMRWRDYTLHLIDTPGHVDFTYEVSRSLACVEGAILLVDATQGVQAQTLAHWELARTLGLAVVPVVNKIDLPAAEVERSVAELAQLIGVAEDEVLRVSAKDGTGVAAVLDAVCARVPPPRPSRGAGARALIFDSRYDDFRGVVAAVRVFDGTLRAGDGCRLLGTGAQGELLEVGTYTPHPAPLGLLSAGDIGYVVTGLKDIRQVRVGDTLAAGAGEHEPLPGYREIKPMVFAGLFPAAGHDPEKLREALTKLKLNDASLSFDGEHSAALGFGFRAGFLGLLHLDITRERLRREYGVEVVITTPSVAYRVTTTAGERLAVHGALELPPPERLALVEEPVVHVDIVTPGRYLGNLMTLVQEYRGQYLTTDYLGAASQAERRAVLRYELPLAAILVDFYTKVKGVSQGYASLSYELVRYQACRVRRLDIVVADELVEALASVVYEDEAYRRGRALVEELRAVLPRQMFEVKIQAALGGKVIAAERLPALRKDVLKRASSGGDVTRKRKLLEKQKAGKRRMRLRGRIDIPPEAYLKLVAR